MRTIPAIATLGIYFASVVHPLFAQPPGTKLWEFNAGGIIRSTPAIGEDGTLYFGCQGGKLYALNPDGTKKWECATGAGELFTPALGDDGTIYVGGSLFFGQGRAGIFAINGDGTKKWEFTAAGQVNNAPAVASDGTIYSGPYEGQSLFAFNPDGSQKWRFNIGNVVATAPAIGPKGTIYFGSHDSKVYAVNPDGTKKWDFLGGNLITSSPSLGADGTVYVGSYDAKIYAINPDGSKRWEHATGGPILVTPTLAYDGTVLVGSTDGKLYALNSLGNLEWNFATGRDIYAAAAVAADGTIYVPSTDGTLYALTATGNLLWFFTTGGHVWACTIGTDGTVYIGSQDGKLYALKGTAPLANSPWPVFRQNLRNNGRSTPPQDPYFTAPPRNQTVSPGQTATFSVVVQGNTPISYQWFKDGTALTDSERIRGAQSATLEILSTEAGDAGRYSVVANDEAGTITSSAELHVEIPAPEWTWAHNIPSTGGGFHQEQGACVVFDETGAIYLTGWFSGTADFGGTNVTSRGGEDVFLAKYSATGTLVWVRAFGGTSAEWGYALGRDAAGNLYISGGFDGTAGFDEVTLTSRGGRDIFVAKCDPTGNVLWAKSAGGGDDYDWSQGLTVDSAGDAYLTGQSHGTVEFGNIVVPGHGYYDIFVAKIDRDGNWVWAKTAGSATSDAGSRCAVLPDGNLVVVGGFQGPASFGALSLTSAGDFDAFVAKYDRLSGEVIWAENFAGSGNDWAGAVHVDLRGSIYVGGYFSGTVDFGGISLTSIGDRDAFSVLLTDSAGGPQVLRATRAGGAGFDSVQGLGTDADGNLYLSGNFYDSINVGGRTLQHPGTYNIFLAKQLPDGSTEWAKSIPVANGGWGQSGIVGVARNGSLAVTGGFLGTAVFDAQSFTSIGGVDTFLASIQPKVSPPRIVAPADMTTSTDQNKCEATIENLGTPVVTSDCAVATVTSNAPAVFPKGETIVTWTVTDTCGNTSSATQKVFVNDEVPPRITPPADVIVGTDPGKCEASNVSLGTPVVIDNCEVANATNDAPALFSKGETIVTWTAIDNSGNINHATQKVTVNDTEKPKITAPPAVVVNTDPGKCEAGNPNLGTPTASDNCAVASVTSNAPAVFPKGATTVTWTATDTSGHKATATQTVTVNDAEPPTIACAGNITLANDAGVCGAAVAYAAPVGVDNCPGAVTVQTAGLPSGAVFPVGTTVNTYQVTDAAGKSASCSFTVTVNDMEPPIVNCPGDIERDTNPGECQATIAVTPATTTDNCGVTVSGLRSDGQALDVVYPKGATMITWTATDTAGNSASCTQKVTVKDRENPIIEDPADVLVVSDAGSCSATAVALDIPTTSDNCAVAGVGNDHPSSTFPLGETKVTWTATDSSGNTSTAVQTVTVLASVSATFLSPLAGQPVANKIRHGQVVPHKVTLANCSGAPLTTGVTVKLKVQGSDSATGQVFQEVPEDANGVGSDGTVTSDGIMVLTDGKYQFNLDTSNFGDPNTLASSTRYYRSTVTVVDNATLMVLGKVAVNLETRK